MIEYLTDDVLIMSVTSNFRKDFKKLSMYFNLDFDIEYPELNFVYKSFNKGDDKSKRTIFACTKIKFIFDIEKGERYVIAYPMINIYPTIIGEYIKRFNFTNDKAAFIYFARITLMHELVHYFQLANRIFISDLLKEDNEKFDNSRNGKIVEELEYKCVAELLTIISKEYINDKALKELAFIEVLDFEYLFDKVSQSKYEDEMCATIEKLNDILI